MKSWKKQLLKEFDETAPLLSDEVKNAPIVVEKSQNGTVEKDGNALLKKGAWITSCCVAILLAVVFAIFGMCGLFDKPTAPIVDRFVFALEINPTAIFVTDKQGVVKSVKALNEDADVVFYEDDTISKIVNVPLSEAIVTYTDTATKLGYLNLSADANAVRLTSSEGGLDDITESASKSLQSYFRTNGVYAVVVSEKTAVNELCKRLNLTNAEDLSGLLERVDALSDYYGEGANEESLQDFYKTYIVGEQTLEYVKSELLSRVDEIKENAQALSELALCSYEVMMSEYNPFSPLPADYWTIKNSSVDYSDEFSAKMKQMENLLQSYQDKFGTKIESLEELKSSVDVYSSLQGADYGELFASITQDDFRNSAKNYVSVLKNIGIEVDGLEALLSAPQNVQEYLTQYKIVLGQFSNFRIEKYESVYKQDRQSISEEEYDEFVNTIISKYGSLKNFWEKK